jgi:SH3 domain protein
VLNSVKFSKALKLGILVNIKITIIFLLLIVSGLVNAKTVYVTDNMTFNVKVDDDGNSALLATVTSGTPLTILSKKRNSEYAKVRLSTGQVGYILNSYLNPQPASKWYLEQANLELGKLRQENSRISLELATIKKRGVSVITENLTRERDKLANDLNELRLISADAVEVRKERDKLQEEYIKASKELEQLKLENKTLETNANQEWFIYGGLLALFGVLLGYILPKLSWRRKSHHWDTL